MAKRSGRGRDSGDNPRKRVKVVHEAPTSEVIHTSRQLRQLLASEQDLQKARHGLQSFKVFLDALVADETPDEDRLSILNQYLYSAKPNDDDPDAVYLPDIMDTWSFAAQNSNDNIMSAVPVVLALLLKFMSQRLEMKAYGLGIGRTLLQRKQLDSIARNLIADKSKEFVISPTLRLLREVVCFDGGTLAKPVFRARNHTFKGLARNMGIKYLGEGVEDPKRPSARTNAIRYFLAALKFLHLEAKTELLSQRELGPALTKTLRDDPPHLALEILDTLRNQVLKDDKLHGNIKSRLLNSQSLSRIASLYGYEHDTSEEDNKASVEDAAHAFLMDVCTTRVAGVLRPQGGYYPRGIDPDAVSSLDQDEGEEASLESIVWMDKFKDEIPVRNIVLAEFIQTLRPWSSLRQSELTVAIFNAAPELVAHYFVNKKSFTFEPKLSATWIGYAAFLFSTILVPIPPAFGHQDGFAQAPPPTSLIMDNIIPLPLNQKVLGRCLVSKPDLIPFFAIRLLVIAMQKLQTALRFHREVSGIYRPLWAESSRRLVDSFCQKIPSMKDVIAAYRGISDEDLLQREAASRLLRLYYEAIPQVALMAKFDVSPFLVTAIERLDKLQGDAQDHGLSMVELENLLAIAEYSPGMRWFSKLESLSMSPFMALVKVLVDAPEGVSLGKLRTTLSSVAAENQLTISHPGYDGLTALLESFRLQKKSFAREELDSVWSFVDNCASRCANAPIKYLETMDDLSTEPGQEVSLLSLAIAEQLPFITASNTQSVLAYFLSAYLGFSKLAKEDASLLDELREKMAAAVTDKKARKQFLSHTDLALPQDLQAWGADFSTGQQYKKADEEEKQPSVLGDDELAEMLFVPLSDQDNSALAKWSSKSADELVEEGYASSIISLLSSEHISIRKESLTSILKIAARVKESSYEEKEQVWLLLSELGESAKPQVDQGPMPSQIVAFAIHALEVLKNPLHCLYAKVNTYLTRGPAWALDRLPIVQEILQEEPDVDDSYYTGLSWLLPYLLDSLQTPADMALFHRRRFFERLLSLASNPYMRHNMKLEILKVLYRATVIEGGSTTLITRFGIVSWLETQGRGVPEAEKGIYTALLRRIWDTCDQEKVSKWSNGGVQDRLVLG